MSEHDDSVFGPCELCGGRRTDEYQVNVQMPLPVEVYAKWLLHSDIRLCGDYNNNIYIFFCVQSMC